MSRMALMPRNFTLPCRARAVLRPNGDHQLDVEMGLGGQLNIPVGDLPRLKRAIEMFETEVKIDDGHNNRVNPGVKMLGEF